MVEGAVFSASLLCGAAGMAASSSFHRRRYEDVEVPRQVHPHLGSHQQRADDGYDFWGATNKGKNITDRQYGGQNVRKPEYSYDFWNTVDKKVSPSYGINYTSQKAGPYVAELSPNHQLGRQVI
jgi:hypothetical protein